MFWFFGFRKPLQRSGTGRVDVVGYKDPLPNNIIEKAYEVARSGECASVAELEKRLRKLGYPGGYVESHLGGTGIRRSLRQIIKENSKD